MKLHVVYLSLYYTSIMLKENGTKNETVDIVIPVASSYIDNV